LHMSWYECPGTPLYPLYMCPYTANIVYISCTHNMYICICHYICALALLYVCLLALVLVSSHYYICAVQGLVWEVSSRILYVSSYCTHSSGLRRPMPCVCVCVCVCVRARARASVKLRRYAALRANNVQDLKLQGYEALSTPKVPATPAATLFSAPTLSSVLCSCSTVSASLYMGLVSAVWCFSSVYAVKRPLKLVHRPC
jgi:hypothetical protein